MTRFVYNTATTLDGYLADPDHSLSWLFSVPGGDSPATSEPDDPWSAFIASVGVAVLGSSTYEWVLTETDALAHPETWAETSSGLPWFVFTSRTLPVPEGADVTFCSGSVADHLASITTRASNKDVWLMGGGDLAGQFADAGTLDEIQTSIAPVTLGDGAPLLPRRLEADRLRLTRLEQRGSFAHLTFTVTSHPQQPTSTQDQRPAVISGQEPDPRSTQS